MVKTNVYQLSAVKNTLDEAVKAHLSKTQPASTKHIDIKLALGYASLLVCGLTYYYGKTVEFNDSKMLTGLGVGLYALLSLAYWTYGKLVEKNIVYESADGSVVVSAKILTASDDFSLPNGAVSVAKAAKKRAIRWPAYRLLQGTKFVTLSISELFDAEGTLDEARLGNELDQLVAEDKKNL